MRLDESSSRVKNPPPPGCPVALCEWLGPAPSIVSDRSPDRRAEQLAVTVNAFNVNMARTALDFCKLVDSHPRGQWNRHRSQGFGTRDRVSEANDDDSTKRGCPKQTTGVPTT